MQPAITAYRGFDDEPWRLERLTKLEASLPKNVVADIEGLHDHKGCLSVNWRQVPRSEQVLVVINGWAEQNEVASNHYVQGVAIIEDEGGEWPPCL